jgi:serine/threonine protein kinase
VPPSSPGYAAPEILAQDSYSYPVDIYALGVIAWVLLSGGAREMQVPAPPTRGVGGAFSTYVADWKLLAEALKDPKKARIDIDTSASEVISKMTQHIPTDRPNVQALREMPFFRDRVLPEIGEGNPPP